MPLAPAAQPARPQQAGVACPQPVEDGGALIFVGGCDRSGTTIVSRLLAERTSLLVVPEAYFHAVAYRRFGLDVPAAEAIGHWRRRSWGIKRSDPRADGVGLGQFVHDQMVAMYRTARGRGPLRVAESTPENIEVASLLLTAFPGSLVVHTVRDPRAVVASLRRADFGPTTAQECARLWKQRVASGLAAEFRYPDRVIRVRYEEAATELAAFDRIAELVDPDQHYRWDPNRDFMLDPTSRPVQRRANGPIDPARVDTWRDVLRPTEVAAVEYECRELMLALGYEPDGDPDPRSSLRRSFDTSRSALSEFTVARARRGLRIARSLRSR